MSEIIAPQSNVLLVLRTIKRPDLDTDHGYSARLSNLANDVQDIIKYEPQNILVIAPPESCPENNDAAHQLIGAFFRSKRMRAQYLPEPKLANTPKNCERIMHNPRRFMGELLSESVTKTKELFPDSILVLGDLEIVNAIDQQPTMSHTGRLLRQTVEYSGQWALQPSVSPDMTQETDAHILVA